MAIKSFTERQLKKARHTNMYEYLLSRGEPLKKIGSGRYYEHGRHDSLRINTRTGVADWHSKQKLSSFDNAIAFAMELFNEPYDKTVQSLLDLDTKGLQKEKNTFKETREPFRLDNLTVRGNYDTGKLDGSCFMYLKGRGISEETIRVFEKRNLISTDSQGNLIYKRYDVLNNSNEVVGADLQGVKKRPIEYRIKKDLDNEKLERAYFKLSALNNTVNSGFVFSTVKDFVEPPTLFTFEAPLEAMSYFEMNKDKLVGTNSWLLSQGGLNDRVVYKHVEALMELYPKAEHIKLVLCPNHEDKGEEFIQKVRSHIKENYSNVKLYKDLPIVESFDHNEMLEMKLTRTTPETLPSRLEKQADKEAACVVRENRKAKMANKVATETKEVVV